MELKSLTSNALLESFHRITLEERKVSNTVLLHLLEISKRKLYLERGYPSLFEMLIKEFRYSESAAYRRINAMKLLQDVPEASAAIVSGEINLSTASNLQSMLGKNKNAPKSKQPVAKRLKSVQKIKRQIPERS